MAIKSRFCLTSGGSGLMTYAATESRKILYPLRLFFGMLT